MSKKDEKQYDKKKIEWKGELEVTEAIKLRKVNSSKLAKKVRRKIRGAKKNEQQYDEKY